MVDSSDHGGARAAGTGERTRGLLDVGQVRRAVAQRGGHGDDRDVEAGAGAGFGRWVQRAASSTALRSGQRCPRRTTARQEPFDPGLVDVVSDDFVPDLGGADGERQADVSLPDYCDAHCPPALYRRTPKRLPTVIVETTRLASSRHELSCSKAEVRGIAWRPMPDHGRTAQA